MKELLAAFHQENTLVDCENFEKGSFTSLTITQPYKMFIRVLTVTTDQLGHADVEISQDREDT